MKPQEMETEVGRQVAYRSPERNRLGRVWDHGLRLPQRSLACLSVCLSMDLQIWVPSRHDHDVGGSHSTWDLLAVQQAS